MVFIGYNIKIIKTANYIEVYEYEKPISSYSTPKREKKIRERRSFDELEDDEQLERLKRMATTRLNTKHELIRLIDSNVDDRTSFLTLTTKKNIKSREVFNEMFKKFITRFNYNFLNTKKRKLKYIATLEQQERGAYHAHVLLFDIGFLEHKKLTEVWGHGFVWINKLDKLDDVSNVGRYVAKYMEKSIGQELLENYGKKAYYSSHNLNKPMVSKMLTEDDLDSIIKYSDVVYSNEYIGKYFKDGQYYDNPVKYKKIKISKEDKE